MEPTRLLTTCLSALLLLLNIATCNGRGIDLIMKKVFEESPDIGGFLDASELIEEPQVRISEGPVGQSVPFGSAVDLSCEAFGSPPPVVYWLKDGQRVKQGWSDSQSNVFEKLTNYGKRTYEKSGTKAALHLSCADGKTAGVYTCVATNNFQRVTKDATVQVIADPDGQQKVCPEQKRAVQPPKIYMWTDTRIERQGANVQLYCRVRGSPDTKIEWFDGDEQLINDDKDYQILPSGDLLIKNTEAAATGGVYKCVATNPAGQDTAEAFLYATKYDGEDERSRD